MKSLFEQSEENLLPALERAIRDMDVLGLPGEDPAALPVSLAKACHAEWVLLRLTAGDWIEVRLGMELVIRRVERVSRAFDFKLVSTLPRRRLVRVGSPAIERRPRFAGMALRELLIYIEPGPGHGCGLVAIALSRPLAVHPGVLEQLVRGLFALDVLRNRLLKADEVEGWALLGRRAACAAHDMRHLLTLAGLEVERSAGEIDPAVSEGLKRAQTALDAARDLCDHSLAAAEPAPRREIVHLGALLRGEARAAALVSVRADRVPVEVSCPEDLEIQADRAALCRVVRNLLLNAIEASPDGAPVDVEVRLCGDQELRVCVRDQGRGMARADVGELLRFGRSGGGGTGIGTASSEACARELGGALEVESWLGEGTLASLRLPLAGRSGLDP
jgi:signal transduction histidine kinase